MSEQLTEFGALQVGQPVQPEPERPVRVIDVKLFDLALKGVKESEKYNGMDSDTAEQFRSSFARLGNEPSGPELAGMDDTGERRQ